MEIQGSVISEDCILYHFGGQKEGIERISFWVSTNRNNYVKPPAHTQEPSCSFVIGQERLRSSCTERPPGPLELVEFLIRENRLLPEELL
jgi:hypothetical protein